MSSPAISPTRAPHVGPAPLDADTDADARPVLRRLCYEPEPGGPDGPPVTPRAVLRRPPPAPPAPDEEPGARAAVTGVLRIACEVLDGRRPPAHLARHAEPAVVRYWRVAAQRRHVRAPARFGRIRMCHPRAGCAEVAVTVLLDGGVRALAARFEHDGDRWRAVAVRLG